METKQLEEFFNDLENFLASTREWRKRLDRELSSSFSVFNYIAPDERQISRIIADLLKPDGDHGQGTLFLELFLQQFAGSLPPDWKYSLDSASVQCEARTTTLERSRSIDILIIIKSPLGGEFGIGIENKPIARESKDQLLDYNTHLMNQFNKSYVLAFLSRKQRPESIDRELWGELIMSGRAFDWTFNGNFQDWLSGCRLRCESSKLRHFLRDFQLYVQQNFPSYR